MGVHELEARVPNTSAGIERASLSAADTQASLDLLAAALKKRRWRVEQATAYDYRGEQVPLLKVQPPHGLGTPRLITIRKVPSSGWFWGRADRPNSYYGRIQEIEKTADRLDRLSRIGHL
ncbi:hypothetical protein [Actinomadura gamaensis]|uniref:Uncharacterized protein n=1 Tax=Actinomadura gamaensis TaxID=1763541 RepID=A0ABV9TS12_9ACTN